MLKPILLVEDNPRDLELTLLALERSQLANEVIVLRDGAEALDYLLRRNTYADRDDGNPAVLLLDLKLPKVDGLEVLRAVRATAELRSIPTVMLTSSRRSPTCCAPMNSGSTPTWSSRWNSRNSSPPSLTSGYSGQCLTNRHPAHCG
ncbi:response regulator receiver protein [Pseudomonas putida]|nr:response regulator receiver protein [Pseudomonas putida]